MRIKLSFTSQQIKFLITMGLVMGFRELSMTMTSPFVNIYGSTLKLSTPLLCGIALGIYGLTNALFQIPYGSLSDRIGRKPVILIGLTQLGLGLLLVYFVNNIYLFIVARAIQGSGAVMAIAYAWLGDVIEDKKKNSAMGIAGTIVALGGVGAFVVGPMLYKTISLPMMSLICSLFIFLSFTFILIGIKESGVIIKSENQNTKIIVDICNLIKNRIVLILCVCGFIINIDLSSMFFIVPDAIQKTIGVEYMWLVFLPAVVCGVIFMQLSAFLNDKGYFLLTSTVAFVILALGWIILKLGGFAFITAGSILIMTGFMCLTAAIPSEMNKCIESSKRGAANGFLQTMTFLGYFCGPTLAGFFIQSKVMYAVYAGPIVLSLISVILIKYVYGNKRKALLIEKEI